MSVVSRIHSITTFNSRDYIDQVISILTAYHSVLSSIAGRLEQDSSSLLKSWSEEVMSQVLIHCVSVHSCLLLLSRHFHLIFLLYFKSVFS